MEMVFMFIAKMRSIFKIKFDFCKLNLEKWNFNDSFAN
jgi:hypothetical protein